MGARIYGGRWNHTGYPVLLDIPSAVVKKEVNTLINPLHPDIKFVDLTNIEKFSFDSRLFKQK